MYEYDCGHGWEHGIVLEAVGPVTGDEPRACDGRGACPPEDVGGLAGAESERTCNKRRAPLDVRGTRPSISVDWPPLWRVIGVENRPPNAVVPGPARWPRHAGGR